MLCDLFNLRANTKSQIHEPDGKPPSVANIPQSWHDLQATYIFVSGVPSSMIANASHITLE